VLANSPQVAHSVVARDGVPSDRVWTVTNFVDDRAFDVLPTEQRTAIRAGWGVPAGAVVIGCVARLVPVKDHATLMHAFAQLQQTTPGVHLVLIGDGESRPALEALAVTTGVQSHVTFAGELRGGENHHRAFDISVLCSLSEGFPNSLVEAMAAGVPIVATRVGGIVDAVADGQNGLLVPVGGTAELTDALRRLATDATLREAMGATGRTLARERYTAREAVRSLETMYDTLLRENSR
jgi:glycosyltransferase involved in cell wall biosynthesis